MLAIYVLKASVCLINEYLLNTKYTFVCYAVLSCSVVYDSVTPMDCSPPGSSVHVDSPGKNTGVGCHALLKYMFSVG